jgi:hypothetical protein
MDVLIEVLIIVIIWLVLCGTVGAYAGNKGRSGVGAFFLSLLLTPLVGFVIVLAMRPNEAAQGKKCCPECSEFVQPNAKICRFCQHRFTEADRLATEVEQLAAKGIPAGPPCPKCGSVNTFLFWEKLKTSRWWKHAHARFFHCHNCSEKWKPEGSPVESSLSSGVVLAALIALMVLVMMIGVYVQN